MFRKITACLACVIGFVGLSVALTSTDAVAKHIEGHTQTHAEGHGGGHAAGHSERSVKVAVHLTGELSMRSQRISADTLFVALGVDAKRHIHAIKESSEFFQRVLNGLRHGDESLGLPAVQSPEARAQLDRLEALWHPLDEAVRKGLKARVMGAEEVDAIARLNLALLREADLMVDLLKDEAARIRLYSMLVIATDLSGRQHTLIHRMSKEFLLIAYGHNIEKHRENLARDHALFEHNLAGLIDGDAQMKLFPPPTLEIELQLRRVKEAWRQFRPLMEAAEQGQPDRKAIAQVAQQVLPLAEEMEEVVHLLEAL